MSPPIHWYDDPKWLKIFRERDHEPLSMRPAIPSVIPIVVKDDDIALHRMVDFWISVGYGYKEINALRRKYFTNTSEPTKR